MRAETIAPSSPSAVDDIVAALRQMIVDDGLGVGDRLPTERELCDRFSTSRNTVREAMRILKAYGIVEVRPKVGATIVDNRLSRAIDLFSLNMLEVNLKTFTDIQGFRGLLEVASFAALLDRITPEDIADLQAINDGLLAAPTIPEAAAMDFEFHTRLVSVMDNKAMLEVYQIMRPVILRIMETGKTRRTFETSTHREHEGIIAALVARDRIAYQYRMKTHLEAGFIHFRNHNKDAATQD